MSPFGGFTKNIVQVLLPEDEAWDGVGAKTDVSAKLAAVNSDMAVIRDKIKTALYKKTVLANELENIRSVCSRQEAVIQQQVLRGTLLPPLVGPVFPSLGRFPFPSTVSHPYSSLQFRFFYCLL